MFTDQIDPNTGLLNYGDTIYNDTGTQTAPTPTDPTAAPQVAPSTNWTDPATGKTVDLAALGLTGADVQWYQQQAPRYLAMAKAGQLPIGAWGEQGQQYAPTGTTQADLSDPAFWDSRSGVQALENARAGGTQEAQRQAAAHSGGGFGGILGLVLGVGLTAFGVPAMIADALGVPAAAGSAITGGLTSLVTGGDPLTGAAAGAAGGLLGGDSSTVAVTDESGNVTNVPVDIAQSDTGAPNVDLRDVVNTGDQTPGSTPDGASAQSPGDQVLNNATDHAGKQPSTDQTPSGSSADVQAPAPVEDISRPYTGPGSSGFNWQDVATGVLKDPRALAALGVGGLGLIGGALSGVANRANSVELQKMRNQAVLDQIAAQAASGTQAKESYLSYLRSLPGWSGNVGVRAPSTPQPLRRPDGSLVYAPGGGLINNALNPGRG